MAAAQTQRITLGTGVINLPYHHPFHAAERMAFLDHLQQAWDKTQRWNQQGGIAGYRQSMRSTSES